MTDKRTAAKDKIGSNPLCSHVYGIINNDYNIKQKYDDVTSHWKFFP